ncbi:Thioredoxin reductase sirT [Vanrija pseudolonga]|uniref:Thioredoxin reductase sirT n=1 Tax=Vanrija pseudolonga TaxID=143232 RepID=A0AAF0YEB8_9TREE|nr:Thioredoxin reductase sirT [Vanrija pseudolonga]
MAAAPTLTDLLVIGGGPAGLSAATMFARTLRPGVLYDSGVYRNAPAKESHTIPGFDGADPAAYRSKAAADLARYTNIEVRKGKIVNLVRDDKGFTATDADGRVTTARKVVLATGVKDNLPPIPGLAAQWGRRALHCIFCHGTETANARMGFLLTPPAEGKVPNAVIVGMILSVWAAIPYPAKYLFTHGMDTSTEQGAKDAGIWGLEDVLSMRGFTVVNDKIERIEDTGDSLSVEFGSREAVPVANLLVVPDSSEPNGDAKAWLTEGLLGGAIGFGGALPPIGPDAPPAAMPPRGGVDPRTPTPGLFWAGNAGSPACNVAMAASHGQVAAAVAAHEIGSEDVATAKVVIPKMHAAMGRRH